MNCKNAEELIADRELGLLDADQVNELEEHLSECDDCRKLVGEYALATLALKESRTDSVPFVLADDVLAFAGKHQGKRARLFRLAVPALAAAAVLLAVVLSPVFFTKDSSDMTTLQVLEAYADDFEAIGMEDGFDDYDTGFRYEDFGIVDTLTTSINQ